jgi:hypothetical protein
MRRRGFTLMELLALLLPTLGLVRHQWRCVKEPHFFTLRA